MVWSKPPSGTLLAQERCRQTSSQWQDLEEAHRKAKTPHGVIAISVFTWQDRSTGHWQPSSPLALSRRTAPCVLFNGPIWPRTGFASPGFASTALPDFLPLSARADIPRGKTRKSSIAILRFAPAPKGEAPVIPGLAIAIEAARGGPGAKFKET